MTTTTQAPLILEVQPSAIAQEVIDRRTGKEAVAQADGKARVAATAAKGKLATKGAQSTVPGQSAPKGPTKKQQVLDMAKRLEGVTAAQIVETLKVTPVAARALIGDVRRMGHKVELDDKGAYRVA